jgi:hypothetical protein
MRLERIVPVLGWSAVAHCSSKKNPAKLQYYSCGKPLSCLLDVG